MRHGALTDSRPFTNLTCIILHVVNLIILRAVDLAGARTDGFKTLGARPTRTRSQT